jgi:hypothetical protein
MKTTFLMLSAAAGLLIATSTEAAPRELQPYLDSASAAATERLAERGVATAESFRVKARIGADGRVLPVDVQGAGSAETAIRARQALRGLRVAAPPPELAGRQVSLVIGPAAVERADVR